MVRIQVEHAVARTGVTIPGLSDTTRIDDESMPSPGAQDAQRFGQHAGKMGVPYEADIRVEVLELLLGQEKGLDPHPALRELR